MASKNPTDIPARVNFQDPAEARAWTQEAEAQKPWREEFFRAFARELAGTGAEELSVLELGSGPGFLAQRILEVLPHTSYTALDYSPAMHELARQRLGTLSGGVRFVDVNFKLPDWNLGMPTFDAVISMQSVHEVRHKSRVPALFTQVRKLLHKGGLFLMCDHYAGEGGKTDTELHMTIEEQRRALEDAGFSGVTLLLQDHGLALWRARVA